MTWQFPLILNIIFATLRGTLEKKLVGRIDPFLVFFYTVLWGTLFFLLFYFLRHQTVPPVYPEMILLGILFTFAYGSYLTAIKISLSQSAIFSSYYLFISLFLAAVFLGEWQLFDPTESDGQRTITGAVLAFVAIFLLLFTGSKKEEKMERKWVVLIAINIILNGIGTYWGKVFLGSHGSLETLISQSLGGLPVLYIINILRKNKLHIPTTSLLLTMVNGMTVVFAVTFFYLSIKNGPLTLILPIQTFVLTVAIALVGLIIFREAQKFTKIKIVGLILGMLGIVLLMI